MAATKFAADLRARTLSGPKECCACNTEKPVDQFYKNPSGMPVSYCKPCYNRQVTERNRRNPEQTQARRSRWTLKQFERLKNRTERTCSKCKLTKSSSEFFAITPTSVTLSCADCENARERQRRRNDPAYRAKCNAAKALDRAKQDKNVVAAYNKQWRNANAAYKRGQDKGYRKSHPGQVRQYQAKYNKRVRSEVAPAYVASLLRRSRIQVRATDLPSEMVEAFRHHIYIKRELDETANETN